MKILLLHSEDDPEKGAWTSMHWDRIIDLGMGGANGYERWARQFHCPIGAIDSFRNGFETLRQVRELLGLGHNRVVDAYGLDWWEIMSLLLQEEVETLVVLEQFAHTVASGDEVYVSRPGLHASLLESLLAGQVRAFALRRGAGTSGLGHYVRVFKKLSTQQMIDVFWDKYDSGYQFRRRFPQKRAASKRPVVLLPTAYVNVTRTGMAYANTFPDENFLLVATRRSGWVENLPPNVERAWLSSYATVQEPSDDKKEISNQWRSLVQELEEVKEFKVLSELGYMDSFPQRLRRGIEVRDAWRNVIESEPVQGVLCADDSNPYTRIPLLLAQARGLPNIACHHGALDGRYAYKRTYGDVIWAKGKMEQDYLVRKCGVPGERVEIAAPALPPNWQGWEHSKPNTFRPYLLFISEAVEVSGGRAEEFYRDLVPPLADLALASGRELIVKLHPFESKGERASVLKRILSAEQRAATRIVSGPLTEELFDKTWFGITILSTVAIECAIRGIPCFLCKWLDFLPHEYVEQFLSFKVGIGLNSPDEIPKIPEFLQLYRVQAEVRENCWQPAEAGRLRELLSSSRKECTTAGS